MPTQSSNPDLKSKSLRVKRLASNLNAFLLALLLHAFLQALLGSLISGSRTTVLPQTIQMTLLILNISFVSTLIGLVSQTNNVISYLREKFLIAFLATILVSIVVIFISRIPYSAVFLFCGFFLQLVIWIPVILQFEKNNRAIIGVPKQYLSNFAAFVPAADLRAISSKDKKIQDCNLIVLKESEVASPEWADTIKACFALSIPVNDHANFIERVSGKVDLDQISFSKSQQLVSINLFLIFKRLSDILFSAISLMVLLPFMLIIAILIRFDSPGKVIFKQQRVGLGGKAFTMYKYRSMKEADDTTQAKFADVNDKRITKIGKFLRKTRIDELPQLWNVLIGDMSVIGPRPEQLGLIDTIQDELPLFSLRHAVRPGITGWAQVCQGYADDLESTRAKLAYDLWYVNNVSAIVDISIAVRTLRVLLTGFGSR